MKTLKQMADELMGLTECGGIRSYFDAEADPEICVYDSSKIFNLFCCCEEVAYHIWKGGYSGAEEIIDTYYGENENMKKVNVAEMIFIYKLENGQEGIVRADNLLNAVSRVNDYYGNHACVYVERKLNIETLEEWIEELEEKIEEVE